MRVKDVPIDPAYLVWHDAFDKGAMDVFGYSSLERAQELAKARNEANEQSGNDEAGFWKAYTKLPRNRIYQYKRTYTL